MTELTYPVLTKRLALERAADHIEANIKAFDMEDWARKTACGTVACFAGHIVWANNPEAFVKAVESGDTYGIQYLAADMLGIMARHAKVFHSNDWVTDNRELVPAAIRWMAEHDILDWQVAGQAVGFKGDPDAA